MKKTGRTIIVSSHIIESLTNVCDFIYYLEKGKIQYSQSKENFAWFEKHLFSLIEKDKVFIIDELIK